jgi:hypothetical protein
LKQCQVISKIILLVILAISVALSADGQALAGSTCVGPSCYGESIEIADLQDQRNFLTDYYNPSISDGGLSGSYSGFYISWNIWETSPGSGLWNYEYIYGGDQDPSSFILELTDENTILTDISVTGLVSQEGPQEWTQNGQVEFTGPKSIFGGPIFGMKWETQSSNPVTISFQTTSDPVWGNFHLKAPNDDVQAYNNAFATSGFASTDKLDFIARPDGGGSAPIVPEPVSSTLFIVGGATLGLRRFWKKFKK